MSDMCYPIPIKKKILFAANFKIVIVLSFPKDQLF